MYLNRFRFLGVSWALVVAIVFLGACDTQPQGLEEEARTPSSAFQGTESFIPTIYPTYTPRPTATPFHPPTLTPTRPTATPVDFDQTVVELTYSIPGLGLRRDIRANVSNHIELTDRASGETLERSDQPGVVIQLQGVLRDLDLEPVPENCPMCVSLEYELPIEGVRGSGWLQDIRLLASLENYTAALLGPYFPENTVVGLRRSATPYQVAHTIAVTEDGQIWGWTAVDSEVPLPEPANALGATLLGLSANLDKTSFSDFYVSECPQGPGVEMLYLAGFPEAKQIRMTCPELNLPTELLPLYKAVDNLADSTLGLQELAAQEAPEKLVPLNALLDYEREDGWRLTVFDDGTAVVIDDMEIAYTSTLTVTNVISLTTALAARGVVQPGTDLLTGEDWQNKVFLRGTDGVYEAVWNELPGGEFNDFVDWLEAQVELVVRFYVNVLKEQELTPTPAETLTITLTVPLTITQTETSTPAATITPSPQSE